MSSSSLSSDKAVSDPARSDSSSRAGASHPAVASVAATRSTGSASLRPTQADHEGAPSPDRRPGASAPARQVPAVLVTAPASGHGKTTVVAALARRYTRQGLRVRVFKCGPDYLDPAWHAIASGQPVHNLDLWMTGEDDIRQRLYEAAADADLILIEGVMGLYDGEPSAAELARRLDLPVLAVIDAAAMTGTFGALAHGLRTWMPGLRWAGALANRVASPRHAALLATACQRPRENHASAADAAQPDRPDGAPIRPAVSPDDSRQHVDATAQPAGTPAGALQGGGASDTFLGCIRRDAAFGLPSRHLGLVPGDELDDALARLDAAADALAYCRLADLDTGLAVRWLTDFHAPAGPAHSLPALPGSAHSSGASRTPPSSASQADAGPAAGQGASGLALAACTGTPLSGKRIAIARDAAFAFIYQANLDTLEALGASLHFFSPLAGDDLPDCDALWLPGGYPELHAERLAGCRALAARLRGHVEAGKPVWAECGGMLPLFESLEYDGHTLPMWGVLPGSIEFQTRLAGLGMQQLAWPDAVAAEHGTADGSGSARHALPPLRGHTFHYSRCITPLVPVAHSHRPDQPEGGERSEAVYQHGNLRASYFHAWFASSPLRAAAFFLPQPEPETARHDASFSAGAAVNSAAEAASQGTQTPPARAVAPGSHVPIARLPDAPPARPQATRDGA